MIELCQEAGLPEPDFKQQHGSFVVTLWRDWLTDKVMVDLGLNDRQRWAANRVRNSGSISNVQYREVNDISERTALRELQQLTKLGVLKKVGDTGRATHYIIANSKPAINPP